MNALLVSRCHQEYTEHKLLALDREKGEIIIDRFRYSIFQVYYIVVTLFYIYNQGCGSDSGVF